MNIPMVLYFLSSIILIEAGLLLVPLATAVIYGEWNEAFYFLITIIISIIITASFRYLPKKKRDHIYAREGLATVGLAWIIMSLVGCLPFYISGVIPSFVDSFFETVSGFTTTGASILKEIESLPKSMLLWRSFTHWIGGMGILVFMLALTNKSSENGRTMHLLRAESPGHTIEKLVPRMSTSTAILYGIYIGLTLLEVILLIIGGMPVFHSLVNSFATAGTGGFAVLNNSIEGYNSIFQQNVITIFMLLFGVNFNFYFLILIGKWKKAISLDEVKWYGIIVLASILIITFNTYRMFTSIPLAVHDVAFTVSSIITTTGFGTVDFNTFPTLSKMILVMLMFCGACAGSTGGGFKVSRVLILVKHGFYELYRAVHPRTVKLLHIDNKALPKETLNGVQSYLTIYTSIFLVSCVLVSVDNFDFTSTITAVVACLNNIGPGLEMVGTTGNYSEFSNFSKIVLSFNMLIGRLEIFPILALCLPSMWYKRV
ncbi:MAG: TrkH family potassium uptake protein [Lachnospirales bacterium]